MESKESNKKNNSSEELLHTNEQLKKPKNEKSSGGEKGSNFQVLVKKVGYAFLFLLIGMLIITLTLYLPAASDLREARAELERLTTVEAEYAELREQFTSLQQKAIVYKVISDSSFLETALNGNDTTRISQQLRYIEEDLDQLQIPEFPEVKQRLDRIFSQIRTSATSDLQEAQDDLKVFLNDLLLLVDNLE